MAEKVSESRIPLTMSERENEISRNTESVKSEQVRKLTEFIKKKNMLKK